MEEKNVISLLKTSLRRYVDEQTSLRLVLSLLLLNYLDDRSRHPFHVPDSMNWDAFVRSGVGLSKRISRALEELAASNPKLENVFDDIDFSVIEDPMLHQMVMHIHEWVEKPSHAAGEEGAPDYGTLAERLIEAYAQRDRKTLGDYVTPPGVAHLMVNLLDIRGGKIYDGASGFGQLLIRAAIRSKKDADHTPQIYGQEKQHPIWSISIMNLILHDLHAFEVYCQDAIEEPLTTEDGQLLPVDYAIMHPPHGQRGSWKELAERDLFGRFRYGIPSNAYGDAMYVLHAEAVLNESGKAAVIVPSGVLIRGASEQKIRRGLMMDDLIETVISLPSDWLTGQGVSKAILILNKRKPNARKGNCLFIHI